ncbi:hypothetical protein [Aquitalea sp. ASV11]|uniref:hypothetical protein n=1 Tax=Aquitalea sp. ASV11 TaxID=2795103 RepID=UPI0018EA478D|nr:hypothetical protein [Aquitalea sp. ASV11]
MNHAHTMQYALKYVQRHRRQALPHVAKYFAKCSSAMQRGLALAQLSHWLDAKA